jgi:Kdo2-lipid IVA lauroyltransferase/acyltransferase
MDQTSSPPIPFWLRLLSRLPLSLLYALGAALVFVVHRVLRIRLGVIRENIAACFPHLSRHEVARMVTDHYRQFGQMFAEVVKGSTLSKSEFMDRVRVVNISVAQELLAQGRPVLLVASHQGNWEWVLQALALQLGYPLDVGYKPIKTAWVEAAFGAVRRRFGAHLVPAKDLLPNLLQRRHIVRGIAILADQSPTTSDHKHWVNFLGRDTAFYTGPEQIARATRYAALFVAMRRTSRGRYEIEFSDLAASGEQLAPGEFTTRYAKLVEREVLAAPTDWTWGHRRWKLSRGVEPG